MKASQDSPVRQVRWVGRDVIVEVHGDIDLRRSVDFQQALLVLMDDKPARILIDLSDVPYMDSSGIASLVKILSRARRDGTVLRLFGLSVRVRSLFEITRLDNVFEICATEAEALA